MTPYIKEYYYRRNLGINIKPKLAFEAQMTIIAENIDTLFDAIDMKVKLQYIDLEAEEISPKRVAEKIRSFFGIDSGPIRNVIETIQRMGVIINYFIPPFSIRIDGVSFITKKGIPVILINKIYQILGKYLLFVMNLVILLCIINIWYQTKEMLKMKQIYLPPNFLCRNNK